MIKTFYVRFVCVCLFSLGAILIYGILSDHLFSNYFIQIFGYFSIILPICLLIKPIISMYTNDLRLWRFFKQSILSTIALCGITNKYYISGALGYAFQKELYFISPYDVFLWILLFFYIFNVPFKSIKFNAFYERIHSFVRIKKKDTNYDIEDLRLLAKNFKTQPQKIIETPMQKESIKTPTQNESKKFFMHNEPSVRTLHNQDCLTKLPRLELLQEPIDSENIFDEDILNDNARELEAVLSDFGIRGEIIKIRPGPVVTLYELKPAAGIKSSRVIGLADDIARSMSALSARVATVPGQNVIGIELPNHKRQTVFLRELLSASQYENSSNKLPLALGKSIGGDNIIVDLAKMPHLLIAGTTGSGKSVAVNAMIVSLLYKLSPNECKFIMIDPKMLEFSVYDGIPHLVTPVVTDPKKAVAALKWTVREMEERYKAMSKIGVRNIEKYNMRVKNQESIIRTVQTGFDQNTGDPILEEQLLAGDPFPFIVVIVDEMADLMLVAGKEIESAVQRLAQMARAAGIHLIMATQRPSVDVITGIIKANFPTRISFQVTSKIDSRIILGEQGAEHLLGQGDMLYMATGGRITRIHAPYVDDLEIEEIVHFLRSQKAPEYIEGVTEDNDSPMASNDIDNTCDELYNDAIELIMKQGKASASMLQRHMQVGYNRAARMIDQMEADGIVSAPNHVGKREILKSV